MTLGNVLSQMGIGTKQFTDRYSDYSAPGHDQYLYSSYDPHGHGHEYAHDHGHEYAHDHGHEYGHDHGHEFGHNHGHDHGHEYAAHDHGHGHGHSDHYVIASSKHHGGGKKSNAAMSALTLLAFLFFLHILQSSLKDHMTSMSNPPVMIMTAKRDGDQDISRTATRINKVDKSGVTQSDNVESITPSPIKEGSNKNIVANEKRKNANNNNNYYPLDDDSATLARINTAEHVPKMDAEKYKSIFSNY